MADDKVAIREWVEAFRESDAHYRWLFEKAPVAISISRGGRTIHVNRKYLELYGFESVGELIGRPILDQWSPESQPMVSEYARRRTLGQPAPTQYEGTGRRKDGSEFPVQIVVEAVDLPDGAAFVAFLSDITQRRFAEESLQRQSRLSELLMKMSATYINVPLERGEAAIGVSLGELAECVEADRIRVQDYDFRRGIVCIRHEWQRRGVAPISPALRELRLADFPEWDLEAHRRGEPVWIPDPALLPAGNLCELLQQYDIKSLLSVPIMHSGQCLGFVSFNWTRHHHACSGDEQRLLCAFAGMLVNIRRRQRSEHELLAYQRRLQALAGELASTEDRQRHDLATVLHDGIGQILFSAAAKLVSLRDGEPADPAREAIDSVLKMLDKAMRDTRELTQELAPPVLYEIGLKPALERLAEKFAERQGSPCTVAFEANVPAAGVELRGMLYQAARELLANVRKHARARSVGINVRGEKGGLSLSVEDDGVGFDPATAALPGAARAGFGLFNIRERLRALGGHLDIASALGKGCLITLFVPLNAPGTTPEGACHGNPDHPRG